MYRSYYGQGAFQCIPSKVTEYRDEKIGHCFIDMINGSRWINWVKIGKNTYGAYERFTADNKPALIATEEYIVLNSTSYDLPALINNCVLGETITINTTCRYVLFDYLFYDANGKQVIPYIGMKISKEGVLLSKIPASVKKETEKLEQGIKDHRNMQARSRYHNNKAVERLDLANQTGDWSNVEIMDVFKIWNVSMRRELIEHFGMNNILQSFNQTTLDKDTVDDRPYELISIDLPVSMDQAERESCLYLKMTNPSTGEFHFEGVPNVRKEDDGRWVNRISKSTVRSALAWRDDEDNYQTPEVLT